MSVFGRRGEQETIEAIVDRRCRDDVAAVAERER